MKWPIKQLVQSNLLHMKRTIAFLSTLCALNLAVHAQSTITLTGTVKSITGEAAIGADIIIKGTLIGTSADVEGKFKLVIPENVTTPTLVISSVGYITQEVLVGNQRELIIILIEDLKLLGEVVVTGYQTEERSKILGSVATVNPDLLKKITVSGVDQALQGRIPGVVVTQNTGAPGEGVSVRIRGTGSLNSSNQPLYVVDGLPTDNISSLSPQDILTVSVLKDASAATIYGARATNGVVLITTRTATSNKQVIEFNTQFGVQNPVRLVPMASSNQYVSIYNEAATTDNVGQPTFLQRDLITDAMKSGLPNVDQVKAIMRPDALIQSHSLSISGGEGKTHYLLSGSYFGQEGIIKASNFNRITGRINIDTEVKKWLKAGVNMNISSATTDLVGSSGDGAGGNGGSVVRYAYFRSPAINIYDANGEFIDKPDTYSFFGDGYNPVGMLAYNNNKRLNDRLLAKFFIVLKPLEGLTFTSNFGVDYTNQNTRRFDRNWGTLNRVNNPSRLTVTDERFQTITFSNFANYTKVFGKQSLTILLGTEAIKRSSYALNSTDNTFSNQNPTLTYLNNGQGLKTVGESQSGSALLSFFAKVNYDYNEKYLVSATIRRDGSSRFGQNNRWGNFYAGSLGWRLDKESFLLNNKWIDKLLVRAGYGFVGNQEIGNYEFSDALSVNTNYPFGQANSIGYVITKLGNANIKWESSKQLNAGIDLVTSGGKLTMSLDYFSKITSDLLVGQPIASSAGLATPPTVNNGEILNRGIELALNYSNTIRDFNYSISPNVAFLHNEVLAATSPIPDGAYGSQYTTLTEKGYQVGSFYMLEMQGIFQSNNEIFTSAKPAGAIVLPGDVKFKDQNGDGIIDGKDRTHLGSAIPLVTAGLNIGLSYKNFDLSIFFQGSYGQKILSVLNRDIEGFYRPFNVTERYFTNHWTPTNPSNEFPRASWTASSNNAQISSRFLEDGSYTRLKNLQFGYVIPRKIVEQWGITSLRIYATANNLITITNYSGMDPEMTVSDNSRSAGDKANGIDWGTFPAARSYNFGVTVTF